jgi:hypothetical protein
MLRIYKLVFLIVKKLMIFIRKKKGLSKKIYNKFQQNNQKRNNLKRFKNNLQPNYKSNNSPSLKL